MLHTWWIKFYVAVIGLLLVLRSYVGNTDPIFSKQGNTGAVKITAANVKNDGTGTIGTDIFKAFTAGASGAFVQKVRVTLSASTAATATTATVFRVYISSITAGATTNADTFLWGEVALPAQTADQTTTATNAVEIPLGFALPANWTVLVSTHHAPAANTMVQAIVIGGDY
jgi:hypothetical protein